MYQPSAEQAEKDREKAFEKGVPHGESGVADHTISEIASGFVAAGDKYRGLPTIELTVVSAMVSPSFLMRLLATKSFCGPA